MIDVPDNYLKRLCPDSVLWKPQRNLKPMRHQPMGGHRGLVIEAAYREMIGGDVCPVCGGLHDPSNLSCAKDDTMYQ